MDSPTSLVLSIQPMNDAHNSKAKILRNGLAIMSYIYLEDFIKTRFGEVLSGIDYHNVPFSDLPTRIQSTASMSALDGVKFRANVLKKKGEDWLSFIQNQTCKISSSQGAEYNLSEYSFGWDKPNISEEDISKALKIFCVQGGWRAIQGITSKGLITLISPQEVFKNAANRRHEAAHNPNADSPLQDIIEFAKNAKIIAFAFDSLITKSLKEINAGNQNILNETKKIEVDDVKLRFILKGGNYWKEYVDPTGRPPKNSPILDDAIRAAKRRRYSNRETILIKNEANDILDWIN